MRKLTVTLAVLVLLLLPVLPALANFPMLSIGRDGGTSYFTDQSKDATLDMGTNPPPAILIALHNGGPSECLVSMERNSEPLRTYLVGGSNGYQTSPGPNGTQYVDPTPWQASLTVPTLITISVSCPSVPSNYVVRITSELPPPPSPRPPSPSPVTSPHSTPRPTAHPPATHSPVPSPKPPVVTPEPTTALADRIASSPPSLTSRPTTTPSAILITPTVHSPVHPSPSLSPVAASKPRAVHPWKAAVLTLIGVLWVVIALWVIAIRRDRARDL